MGIVSSDMDDKVREALTILMEECAEVIYIASKSIRFGLEDVHPVTHQVNKDALIQEIADVMVLKDILLEQGVLNHTDLIQAKNKKEEKLKSWSSLG